MSHAAVRLPGRPTDPAMPGAQAAASGKRRRITGTALIWFVAFALVGAAAAKLARAPFIVNQLRPFGFDDTWIAILGVIELASALLFAVPRTRALGLLLITGFLGGAIATHIQHAQSPAQPAVLLAIGWTGVWLRHREANWSRLEQFSKQSRERGQMRRQDVVLWFSRITLVLVIGILLLISRKYLLDPTSASAERGMVLSTGAGRTIARVGLGAFPLACALVIGACVVATERVRYGLWFVIALFGTVLLVRLVSATVDNSLPDNVPLIIPEVVFLTLTSLALVLGRGRGTSVRST